MYSYLTITLLVCLTTMLTSTSVLLNAQQPQTSSPEDITFQDARLKFYSLLAENYTFMGVYEIFVNDATTTTSSSSTPDYVYECNVSIVNGYSRDLVQANLDSCFNLTTTNPAANRSKPITNASTLGQILNQLGDGNPGFSSRHVVNSIQNYFYDIGDGEAEALSDPDRSNVRFDRRQFGVPANIVWQEGGEGEYRTHLKIVTLIDITGTDPLREQQRALWEDQNSTWIMHRPPNHYYFDLTVYRGNKDELEARVDENGPEPAHCTIDYSSDKDTSKAPCLQIYRIGVTRMTHPGDKNDPDNLAHYDDREYRIYRIIDVRRNEEVKNITQEIVEDGVFLTIQQHMSRLKMAIEVSDSLSNIDSFFVEYNYDKGYPILYSWSNPFYNWFEHVHNKEYNVLRTWRIGDVKEGVLDPPSKSAMAIAAIVMITIAVIVIIACAIMRVYKKAVEDSKFGNKEQKSVVARSIEGGNGPIHANDIEVVSGNNSSKSGDARRQRYALDTGASNEEDQFEMNNTSAFDGGNSPKE